MLLSLCAGAAALTSESSAQCVLKLHTCIYPYRYVLLYIKPVLLLFFSHVSSEGHRPEKNILDYLKKSLKNVQAQTWTIFS